MAEEKNPGATASRKAAGDTGAPDTANGETRPAIPFEADAAAAKPGATQQLRDEASRLGNQAADRARAFAGENKERATNALDEVAKMFEGAALDVDARLGEEYGKYARSAAQGISNFAESLRGKEVDDLFNNATDFVKKSPVIAVGAAAAVGFVVARLIKSGVDAASETSDA